MPNPKKTSSRKKSAEPIDVTPVMTSAPPPPSPTSMPLPPTGGVRHAGFWRRFAAIFLDTILLQVVIGILSSFFGGYGLMVNGDPAAVAQAQAYQNAITGGLSFVLSLIYYVGMESSAYQATLGKMVLGIKVTDLNGNRLSVSRAAGRQISKLLSTVTLGIGYLMAAFTERKQALHDMVAGTLVVRK